jgi:DNA repair exonuclease SbcCD ATPase subunit
MRAKSGGLFRRDKALTLKDVKTVRQEANELARQTKKDLFKPGKMTLREMNDKEKHIDRELNRLEKLKSSVNRSHEEYHRLKNSKHRLETIRERLKLENKRKKTEAKLNTYKKPRKKRLTHKVEIISAR